MHPRFQTAFAQLADNLQSALEPILADKYFPALLTGEQVSSLKSATGLDEDALAFALLPLAAACARTPLSNFNCARCERNLVFRCQYGIYWCDNAANRSCRTKRDQPRLAEW